jgi:hypothetical protein
MLKNIKKFFTALDKIAFSEVKCLSFFDAKTTKQKFDNSSFISSDYESKHSNQNGWASPTVGEYNQLSVGSLMDSD